MFVPYQRVLRSKATEAEKHFYRFTKDLGLHLVFQKKYNRPNNQKYFIDFQLSVSHAQLAALKKLRYPVKSHKCVKHRILVEIDGEYHNSTEAYDFQRECEIINRRGAIRYHFLRFTNNDVLYNSKSVLNRLYAYIFKLWGVELDFEAVRYSLMENQGNDIKFYDF